MFRLLKIIRNYREEINSIEIKQLITDKMTIKAALSTNILIYTFGSSDISRDSLLKKKNR